MKRSETLVRTEAGAVAGLEGERGFAFLGVPYGECMTGELRFRPPVKKFPWRGVLQAHQPGDFCFQPNDDFDAWKDWGTPGEDCLVLNVWTPSVSPRAKCAVLVWIHGGAYTNGSGGLEIYNGARLSHAEQVVVVTINHRLNVFGYLYLGGLSSAYEDSGNLGQLDLILALQWIQSNIAAFGGDPSRVTLFGESGGGAKISTLMAMPQAAGLFCRAIIQSGWLLNVLTMDEANERTRIFRQTLSDMGISSRQAGKLRYLPAGILNAGVSMMLARHGYGAFFPVVDGVTLPGKPWAGDARTRETAVPLLIGTTADEGVYFIPEKVRRSPASSQREIERVIARLCSPIRLLAAETHWITQEYMKINRPQANFIEILIQVLTDILFVAPAANQAERHAANASVFAYRFDWKYPCFNGSYAAHAAEIPFVFGTLDYTRSAFGSDDSPNLREQADPGGERFTLARKIQRAWAEFARTGNPSHGDLPAWPEFTLDGRATMTLDSSPRVLQDPCSSRRKLAAQLDIPTRSITLAE